MRVPAIILAIVGALLLASCSSEPDLPELGDGPRSLAEEMIVGDFATTVGLGPLTASCNDPGPLAVGTTFACTATTDPGEIIQIQGLVNTDGHLALVSTNLLSAAALPSFEREVAASLNSSVGSNFTAGSVDCGGTSIVLPADFVLGCALVMPAGGEVFDVTLTITDLDGRRFSLVVGDQARPAEDE